MTAYDTLNQALRHPALAAIRFNGAAWEAYSYGESLPARAVDDGIPSEVTMRQARLALNSAGKLAAVQSAINAMAEPAKTNTQIWWDYSSTVQRGQAIVASLGAAIGLTSAQVDQLFTVAATL